MIWGLMLLGFKKTSSAWAGQIISSGLNLQIWYIRAWLF